MKIATIISVYTFSRTNTFEVTGPQVGSMKSIRVTLAGNDGIDLLQVSM